MPHERPSESSLPVRRIVRAVGDAAERWRNADFAPRVRATCAIIARTGYTQPVVDYALDRLFEAIDSTTLEAVIADELGALDALDGFLTRRHRPDVLFRAAGQVTIVASDTTIGVTLPALAFALCAKAYVVVKDRDDRLVGSFLETLAEEDRAVAQQARTETWASGGLLRDESHPSLRNADVVIAYGDDRSLSAIRAQLPPHARFVGFGHRTSVGYIPREALVSQVMASGVAHGAARDALLYDGDGCLSVHALFVERGGSVDPRRFADLLAAACDTVAVEFPAGYRDPNADVLGYRRAALFRAAQGRGFLYEGRTSPHFVAFDAPVEEPPPLLRRTVAVYPVGGPHDALEYLRRHALPLEAFAVGTGEGGMANDAAWRADIEATALSSGAAWLASLGRLQAPALAGEHGGQGRILPFVRAVYRR